MKHHNFPSDQFAARLRQKRGDKSRRIAAEEAGVSQSTLTRAENGARPDLDSLLSLCRWMNVDINEFFQQP